MCSDRTVEEAVEEAVEEVGHSSVATKGRQAVEGVWLRQAWRGSGCGLLDAVEKVLRL